MPRLDPRAQYEKTMGVVGYVSRAAATPATYTALGFKCGLEIHQQLLTAGKLFCRCPAGRYQEDGTWDAEVVRHMRPTLSELGEYDGTALMEFRTRKNIIYRIAYDTACTYDIDDTPPFPLDREALAIALEIALALEMKVVGELHITRKQYLDGSIPTGFQRTGIVAIEGRIPVGERTVRLIQLSLEEDACREVSDQGHWRVYTTDRLGTPLIEMVTYPDMATPDEAARAAHHLRFTTRSTGKVRTGIGAAREDVNVSVEGGTRVEIKGVPRIAWIPALTHTEAFRQKALLELRAWLSARAGDAAAWHPTWKPVDPAAIVALPAAARAAAADGMRVVAINLPRFAGALSFFMQPGRDFADELSDRLKVIACIEKPNLGHSEGRESPLEDSALQALRKLTGAADEDAQLLVWGPPDDIPTAVETVEERCRLAFEGVPRETRQALPDGRSLFERVLPGPDRMYPDTDSAPIAITTEMMTRARAAQPVPVADRLRQLREWGVPPDVHRYLLRRNLVGLLERFIRDLGKEPVFAATLLGHTLRSLERRAPGTGRLETEQIFALVAFGREQALCDEILREMLKVLHAHPNMDLRSVLTVLEYRPQKLEELLAYVPPLRRKFREIRTSRDPGAEGRWLMSHLRRRALGNIRLSELPPAVERMVAGD